MKKAKMMAAGGMSKKGYAAGGMLQQIKKKIETPMSTQGGGRPAGMPIRGSGVNDAGGPKPRPRTPLAQAIDMPKPRPRTPLAQAIDMPKPRTTKMAKGGAVKAAAKKKK